MKRLLEIACFSAESAIIAAKAGASRLELCEDMFVGGITPSDKTLDKIKAEVQGIPLFVMIHKMGSKYQYTTRELQWMTDKMDDLQVKGGMGGFVFGALTDKNEPDIQKLEELLIAAENKPCTFHRAFDVIEDKKKALEQIIELGFKRILTSGGEGNAINNLKVLAELNKQANGRIKILVGGGVRSSNVKQIIDATGVDEVHSSAIVKGSWPDTDEIRNLMSAIGA